MKVFGLTGGIATGKSSVARLLREKYHLPVIDADHLAREVVQLGSEGLREIKEVFGEEVLDGSGNLDRSKMRLKISQDPEAKKKLEQITHPKIGLGILEKLKQLAESGEKLAFVEAALMVESGSWKRYQALIVVTCSAETQLNRLIIRDNMEKSAAEALIASQMPLVEKEKFATYLIHNNSSLSALEDQLEPLIQHWIALSQS